MTSLQKMDCFSKDVVFGVYHVCLISVLPHVGRCLSKYVSDKFLKRRNQNRPSVSRPAVVVGGDQTSLVFFRLILLWMHVCFSALSQEIGWEERRQEDQILWDVKP